MFTNWYLSQKLKGCKKSLRYSWLSSNKEILVLNICWEFIGEPCRAHNSSRNIYYLYLGQLETERYITMFFKSVPAYQLYFRFSLLSFLLLSQEWLLNLPVLRHEIKDVAWDQGQNHMLVGANELYQLWHLDRVLNGHYSSTFWA